MTRLVNMKAALAGAAVLTCAAAAVSVPAEEITARLSYHWAPAHHSAIYAEKFAACVNEQGKGEIHIDTYPSAQLFGIRQIMGALTSGAVQMGGVVGIVSFPPVNKNYNVEALPYFKSYKELRGFFHDTEIGQKVWNDILDKTNTVVLAYDPTGPYVAFTTERPLTTPQAFDGLRARYLAGVERPYWSALGANAVSMPTGEVYTALQSGMIDTLSTVPAAIKAYDWWQYLKYGQLPFLFYTDAFIMANGTWYDGLSDDVKAILDNCGGKISKGATDSVMAFSREVLKEFQGRGGEVDTLTPEQQAAFRKVYDEKTLPALTDMIDPDVLEAVQEYTSK